MRLACLLLALFALANCDPTTSTEYGDVVGFEHDDAVEVYLGIPFAKPPLKELRWTNPVPPEPWSEPRQAKNWSASCIPHSSSAKLPATEYSEDCLYLNVITPKERDGLLPVLFYVHGGGYEIGSAQIYGYKAFADIYAKKGIVVVSIQYRLGVMGFLTLGTDSTLKGNYGLFDQAFALEFVHRNIEKFGGDPSRIVVFGISAGAASAGQLALSPLTKDLVSATIEMSGSALSGWANDCAPEKNSWDIVESAGCEGKRTMEMTEQCARKLSIKAIHQAVSYIGSTAFSAKMIKWGPYVDGTFLPATGDLLAQSGKPIPIFTGVNTHESGYFVQWNRAPSLHRTPILIHEQPLFDIMRYEMKINIILSEFLPKDEVEPAMHDVLTFYAGADYEELRRNLTMAERSKLLESYVHFWSDMHFNVASLLRAKAAVKKGSDVYVYQFKHFNDGLFKEDEMVKGAYHINEMAYVFDFQAQGKFEWTPEELKVRKEVLEAMVSFIKTGKPSVDGVAWPAFNNEQGAYAVIDSPAWSAAEHFYQKSYEFWFETMSKYSFDFIQFQKRAKVQQQIPAPPLAKDHEEL